MSLQGLRITVETNKILGKDVAIFTFNNSISKLTLTYIYMNFLLTFTVYRSGAPVG